MVWPHGGIIGHYSHVVAIGCVERIIEMKRVVVPIRREIEMLIITRSSFGRELAR